MSEISTREEFKDLLSGMTDLSDYDDAIAAYDAQAARIAELEEMVRAAAQRIEELTLAARIKELEENE